MGKNSKDKLEKIKKENDKLIEEIEKNELEDENIDQIYDYRDKLDEILVEAEAQTEDLEDIEKEIRKLKEK
ncbi:MAG: hypothetical protein AABX19_04740 [Nanoarchaeota archaeon]